MDISAIATDISVQTLGLVKYILALNISPEEKNKYITSAIKMVGSSFHDKTYNDVVYMFGAQNMKAPAYSSSDQVDNLTTKILREYSLGRDNTNTLIKSYYDSELAKSQDEAFGSAKSMQKHPTLTRKIVNETCGWCLEKVGTHINPQPEDFYRHSHCDCEISVSGYNTRNGTLNNYTKG